MGGIQRPVLGLVSWPPELFTRIPISCVSVREPTEALKVHDKEYIDVSVLLMGCAHGSEPSTSMFDVKTPDDGLNDESVGIPLSEHVGDRERSSVGRVKVISSPG
jgi:hypothetical protein